jgi:exonuclease VII small subunit
MTTTNSDQPTPTSFETNFRKLEELQRDLDNESITIDELVPRAKAGADAAAACFEVLRRSEEALVEIDKVYARIAGDTKGSGS